MVHANGWHKDKTTKIVWSRQRMEEQRLPKQILTWTSPQKKKEENQEEGGERA